MSKYKVVDLFSGAGGLSLGFKQTGYYQIVAAAENNPNAKKTYKKNFPEVLLLDDVKKINYVELKKQFSHIDVVVGGPPCQGFSNANRQKANAISMNNALVKEYVRAIREMRPTVFVMENVSMLRSETHRFYYSQHDKETIDELNISLREDEIELLPKKYRPRPAQPLIDTLKDYEKYLWNEKYYHAINVIYRNRNTDDKFENSTEKHKKTLNLMIKDILKKEVNDDFLNKAEFEMAILLQKYFSSQVDKKEVISGIEKALMLERMYRYYSELQNNEIVINGFVCMREIGVKVWSFSVLEYIKKTLNVSPYSYNIVSGVLNAVNFGAPQKRERYIIIGTIKGKAALPEGTFCEKTYRTVYDAIGNIENIKPSFAVNSQPQEFRFNSKEKGSLNELLCDSELLYNHVITKTKETALKRFKVLEQGQNFHNLSDEYKSTYADEKRTQKTIYLRLKYNEPSGTVVNVRKSMWIHPTIDRALSIREAARLQTFPDSFVFEGTKDAQYQQVGNAVPPILARELAESISKILKNE